MLNEVKEVYEAGGFTMDIPGRGEQTVLPIMALIVQDHPEGQQITGVGSGCRFCACPAKQLSDVDTQHEERNAADCENRRKRCMDMINITRTKGKVQAARDELHTHSLHDTRPALADLPFGALPGGFFASTPSDRMHLCTRAASRFIHSAGTSCPRCINSSVFESM
jgi:hypothetical protein